MTRTQDAPLSPVPPAGHAPGYPGFRERRGLRDLAVALFALPASAALCACLLLCASPAPAHAAGKAPPPPAKATSAEATLHREDLPPCMGKIAMPEPPCLGEIPAAPAKPVSPSVAPCRGVVPADDIDPPCRGDIADPRFRPYPNDGPPPCLGSVPPPQHPEPLPPPCAGVPLPPDRPVEAPGPVRIEAVAKDPERWNGFPVDLQGRLERDGRTPGGYAIVAERNEGGAKVVHRVAIRLDAKQVKASGIRVGGPVRAKGTLKAVAMKDGTVALSLAGARLTPGN